MTGLRTLLVEGAALAPVSLSPLPTLLAGCSTKAREDVVTGGVSGTLALHLAAALLSSSSVLLVFPLAAAPPHQSPLLVFVRQLPPESHLTTRRLPGDDIGLQQTSARPGVRQLGGC